MNGFLFLIVACTALTVCAAQEERIDILGGIADRSKGTPTAPAATKTGLTGFAWAGFGSAILLITFAALIGAIILLLLSGGSFVTIGLSSLTGRKKRDLDSAEEQSNGWFETIGSYILQALENYNVDHSL